MKTSELVIGATIVIKSSASLQIGISYKSYLRFSCILIEQMNIQESTHEKNARRENSRQKCDLFTLPLHLQGQVERMIL